jgi:mRNA-degrading endonuclease HigB of HigAB toxin-antitoxin module
VHVILQKAVREFEQKHANAAAPLRAWLKLVRHGRFQNLEDLKRLFASMDMVAVKGSNSYVFNTAGKMMRIVPAHHPRDLAAGADPRAIDINRQSPQVHRAALVVQKLAVEPTKHAASAQLIA